MMHRTNIYLPEPLMKQLKALAKKEGISVSEIVRRELTKTLETKAK
jgi:metal-responsive CopG/Arc/MetJ family transcriptional regulator